MGDRPMRMILPKYAGQKAAEARARLNAADVLEQAKTILRRRGFIVYDASVIGGPKGFIRVDRELWKPERVIEAAQ